ncbi:MAG: cysteine desulfurase [Clostridia bacterium]|nr:cysteine desulfurase [Clostridia bacterium]
MDEKRIFMDHAAGCAVDARVLSAMLPYFGGEYGNPSSLYAEGVRARRALDEAREGAAACLGAHPDEIYFTSGGTESDNWAIRCGAGKGRILTSELEHPAVRETALSMATAGRHVTMLPVLPRGTICTDALSRELAAGDCSLLTLMYANHETGVLQPIEQAAELARAAGVRILCDAVAAAPTQRIDAHALGVDYLSVSGHKLGAPRGVGILYARRGTDPAPLLTGGGQEMGRRSGTESVALAVGMSTALAMAAEGREEKAKKLRQLSALLLDGLLAIPGVTVNGWADAALQLPGTVNVSVDCVSGASLVLWLDRHGICVSAGSACSSAGTRPSKVLLSMGRDKESAMSAIRYSLGAENTFAEVERTLAVTVQGVRKLRSLDLRGSVLYPELG